MLSSLPIIRYTNPKEAEAAANVYASLLKEGEDSVYWDHYVEFGKTNVVDTDTTLYTTLKKNIDNQYLVKNLPGKRIKRPFLYFQENGNRAPFLYIKKGNTWYKHNGRNLVAYPSATNLGVLKNKNTLWALAEGAEPYVRGVDLDEENHDTFVNYATEKWVMEQLDLDEFASGEIRRILGEIEKFKSDIVKFKNNIEEQKDVDNSFDTKLSKLETDLQEATSKIATVKEEVEKPILLDVKNLRQKLSIDKSELEAHIEWALELQTKFKSDTNKLSEILNGLGITLREKGDLYFERDKPLGGLLTRIKSLEEIDTEVLIKGIVNKQYLMRELRGELRPPVVDLEKKLEEELKKALISKSGVEVPELEERTEEGEIVLHLEDGIITKRIKEIATIISDKAIKKLEDKMKRKPQRPPPRQQPKSKRVKGLEDELKELRSLYSKLALKIGIIESETPLKDENVKTTFDDLKREDRRQQDVDRRQDATINKLRLVRGEEENE